jgi:hypothetical protein
VDQFRQVASYVDRILRGVSPSDLPVHRWYPHCALMTDL